MRLFVVAVVMSVLSGAAFAQAVDCSAFEHRKDGSWTVVKATRLAGVKDGVSTSAGLAPGESFARGDKATMAGVDVFAQVESACR